MIIGAICGFVVAVETRKPDRWASSAAAVAGAALSLIFAVLTQVLLANQVATGLALTLFGLGLSVADRAGLRRASSRRRPGDVPFGPLADIPVLGPILFGHDCDGLCLDR